jgi:hypothetical protein
MELMSFFKNDYDFRQIGPSKQPILFNQSIVRLPTSFRLIAAGIASIKAIAQIVTTT